MTCANVRAGVAGVVLLHAALTYGDGSVTGRGVADPEPLGARSVVAVAGAAGSHGDLLDPQDGRHPVVAPPVGRARRRPRRWCRAASRRGCGARRRGSERPGWRGEAAVGDPDQPAQVPAGQVVLGSRCGSLAGLVPLTGDAGRAATARAADPAGVLLQRLLSLGVGLGSGTTRPLTWSFAPPIGLEPITCDCLVASDRCRPHGPPHSR